MNSSRTQNIWTRVLTFLAVVAPIALWAHGAKAQETKQEPEIVKERHTLAVGETLSGLLHSKGIKMRVDLYGKNGFIKRSQELNPQISNWNKLRPGMQIVLALPRELVHSERADVTVEKGEFLAKIAERTLGNSKKWRKIAEWNELKAPFVIRPGQKLVVYLHPAAGAEVADAEPVKHAIETASHTQEEVKATEETAKTEETPSKKETETASTEKTQSASSEEERKPATADTSEDQTTTSPTEAKSEAKVEAPEAKTEAKTEAAETKTEAKVEAAESKTEAKAEAPETKTEAKAEATETKPEAKAEATETKTEAKAEAKPEATVAKTETKAETKPESKVEPAADTKTEVKTEAKAETKVEPAAETKTEAKIEAKTEPKAEAKTEEAPVAQAETEKKPEPEKVAQKEATPPVAAAPVVAPKVETPPVVEAQAEVPAPAEAKSVAVTMPSDQEIKKAEKLEKKHPDQAVLIYKRARESKPEDVQNWVRELRVLKAAGKKQQFESTAKDFLAMHPSMKVLPMFRGLASAQAPTEASPQEAAPAPAEEKKEESSGSMDAPIF